MNDFIWKVTENFSERKMIFLLKKKNIDVKYILNEWSLCCLKFISENWIDNENK